MFESQNKTHNKSKNKINNNKKETVQKHNPKAITKGSRNKINAQNPQNDNKDMTTTNKSHSKAKKKNITYCCGSILH